jgi:pyrrolidone-carboxylate peptidase
MYVIIDYLQRRHLPARFGFIHIPHDYNVARARRFLARVITTIQAQRKKGRLLPFLSLALSLCGRG